MYSHELNRFTQGVHRKNNNHTKILRNERVQDEKQRLERKKQYQIDQIISKTSNEGNSKHIDVEKTRKMYRIQRDEIDCKG